jgi:hypothetical protein
MALHGTFLYGSHGSYQVVAHCSPLQPPAAPCNLQQLSDSVFRMGHVAHTQDHTRGHAGLHLAPASRHGRLVCTIQGLPEQCRFSSFVS